MATQPPRKTCPLCGRVIAHTVVQRANPRRLMRPTKWRPIPCVHGADPGRLVPQHGSGP